MRLVPQNFRNLGETGVVGRDPHAVISALPTTISKSHPNEAVLLGPRAASHLRGSVGLALKGWHASILGPLGSGQSRGRA